MERHIYPQRKMTTKGGGVARRLGNRVSNGEEESHFCSLY